MTLFNGLKDHYYSVKYMNLPDDMMHRLEALGLNEGTNVKLLNRKKNGAIIIYVRGTRLALGKRITTGIEVEEAFEDE